ncbi:MAG: ECF transporter S component [Clostridia bacterium]|nr:ECF transporter S component [Clostridia bacterium]
MHDEKIKRLTLAGLMCAIVVITTMFAAVPIPGVQGAYANAGDAAVYAAAYLLGWPWGVAVAAVGSGLADILLGSALYAPATLVIKGLMAFIAAKLLKKGGMRVPWLLVSGLVMAAGYFAYECMLYGASVAMLSIPANLIQAVLGAVLGSVIIRGIETLQK